MAIPIGEGARVRAAHLTSVLSPTTTEELRTALRYSTTTHHRIVVRGRGSADAWAGEPDQADAVLDTTALSGVLQYNPADMTVAVRAGTPLATLQREVGRHGQRVAFDAARAARGATVGGLLATSDGGTSRTAYGTLRDLVIGVVVVLADGTVARSGGHVIKNVAGYDLGKLFHGSFGTLGVVAEVVLRLHPAPRAAATVEIDVAVEEAYALGHSIVAAALEPTAVELTSGTHPTDAGSGSPRLLVRFEGTPAGVAERAAAVSTLTTRPVRTLAADRATATWDEVAEVAIGDPGDTVLCVGSLPSDGGRLLGRIGATAAAGRVHVTAVSTLMAGVHTLRLRGGGSAAHDEVLRSVHAAVGPACTVRRRDGLGADIPAWGPPPQAIALMRAVKHQFDPSRRFDTGRLAPWLAASDERGRRA